MCNTPSLPAIRRCAIADIRTDAQPWHVRLIVRDDDVRSVMRSLRAEPSYPHIRVVDEGGYSLVSGGLHLEAARRLGLQEVSVYVLAKTTERALLEGNLRHYASRIPVRPLERGWALERLAELRAAEDISSAGADLAAATGLDPGSVSIARSGARMLPSDLVREVAERHGVAFGALAALPRDAIRTLKRATEEERPILLDAAAEAIKKGEAPRRAVRVAANKLRAANGEIARSRAEGNAFRRPDGEASRLNRLVERLRRACRRALRLLRDLLRRPTG